MRILVDTQIFLWSFDNKSPLSANHRNLLLDDSNEIYVSQISLMEVAIKKAISKLPESIPDIPQLIAQWQKNGFQVLAISDEQISRYVSVPFYSDHRDPFDRFIIGIAKEEDMALISADQKFELYKSFVQFL